MKTKNCRKPQPLAVYKSAFLVSPRTSHHKPRGSNDRTSGGVLATDHSGLHTMSNHRRAPLGEATRRVNNVQQSQFNSSSKPISMPHHESLRVDELHPAHNAVPGARISQGDYYPPPNPNRDASPASNAVNPRLSAISKQNPGTESNRSSQISTVSSNASDGKRIKAYIGPWKLGKTLGKGATARVRLARNAYTGQEAAIKIVHKKNAQISQAGSLAHLDKADANMSDTVDGLRRMPVGVEREVAIMKLIQHPNIMRLYDIWENRTEIYLVLEYVDNGELFQRITSSGRLGEEEAIRYFRQILSAVGYCHSFNICHRDLKPENILLTKGGEIKVADFGMAALHQSPDHKLETSCGSPHYAAPELIRGITYRGEKVDIWSMGVILYASLSGRLPFDVEGTGKDWLSPLLSKIKKGEYERAPECSDDAASLIWRMLQVNPRDRINISQIWRHPLLRKYDYLDALGRGRYPLSPSVEDCGRPVLRRSDINKELLRHLKSLWHTLSEQQLMSALLCEEPNPQKLFYSLLLRYRDAQLENYTPDLVSSASDYHHVGPLALTKTYSTCHFPQPKSKSHTRQSSRFTVISNTADTERSYDPFKASRPQHLDSIRPTDRATVTIHRDPDQDDNAEKSTTRQQLGSRASVTNGPERGRPRNMFPPKAYASRSSLASSTRSRSSAPRVRATIGNRRGVSFSRLRKASPSVTSQSVASTTRKQNSTVERHSNHTEVTDDGGDILRPIGEKSASSRYVRSRKRDPTASETLAPAPAAKSAPSSQIWTEDVRQLSISLAKDCDEAFSRSTVVSASDKPQRVKASSLSVAGANPKLKCSSLDTRPLPAPPLRTNSVNSELLEARKQAELRKASGDDSPGYLDRMVSHIDRLIQPSESKDHDRDRRTFSAPPVEKKHIPSGRLLPSIHEIGGEDGSPRGHSDSINPGHHRQVQVKSSRIASAPEPRAAHRIYLEDRFSQPHSERETIRVVTSPSQRSPVKAPAPLTIRKKASAGPSALRSGYVESGHNYCADSKLNVPADFGGAVEDTNIDDHYAHDTSSGTIIRKTSNWFKRSSKGSEEDYKTSARAETSQSRYSCISTNPPHLDTNLPISSKTKGFSLRRLFKKRDSRPDMTAGNYDFEDDSSIQDSTVDASRQSYASRYANFDDPRARQIEPQQNWLAKLFHVKPASKFICFSVARRRARREITTVLREWRRYGIRDVQADKQRNIVFGKVGATNHLNMKEVSFAGEVMTVIEHGKRAHLSIARFTQERGAASSFHKVVETLENVLKLRGMLITDERKKRMMIKTMNTI
ncbi:Serine/threonine-protein kinase [Lachnellula occidentalis]|uniref:non-specific serine/threonine protein kinase n=1 Tax=Lachnellula occidentalis TaxID=215460 RepID=A0A8H8S786_9HELO|nr:Serine/threonine-protein kinase [Lachnellula occidentalis]